MRKRLVITSLGLTLVGLELSTEAVSLTLARLRAGGVALFSGVDFQVGAPRFVLGLLLLLSGVVLGILTLWSARVWKSGVRVGKACPQCGGRTKRVKRKWWQRLVSRVTGEDMSRRSCEHCGWNGLALTR